MTYTFDDDKHHDDNYDMSNMNDYAWTKDEEWDLNLEISQQNNGLTKMESLFKLAVLLCLTT